MHKYILNIYLGEAPIQKKKKDSIWQKSDLLNNVLNEQLTKGLRFSNQWYADHIKKNVLGSYNIIFHIYIFNKMMSILHI